MSWDNYTYQKPQFEDNKPGNYRCVILGAEVTTSKKSGNRMLVISVRPSGTRATVKSYIVDNDYFDSNFSQFLDAFPQIKESGSASPDNCFAWRGAVGAVKLNVNEDGYFEAKWFLAPEKAEDLPEFVWKARDDEPQEMPVFQELTELTNDDDESDIPF